MAVPTNLDPASAQDLGTLPFSISEDVTDAPDFNVHREVWFTYTHATDDVAIAWAALATLASGYQPIVRIYDSLAAAIADDPFYLNFDIAENVPLQVPVVTGTTYYMRVGDGSFPVSATAPLTVTGSAPPALAAPARSILINDDTAGFPLVIISSVDGSVLQLRNADGRVEFPAGEAGIMLPSGISLWSDVITAQSDFTLISPPPTFARLLTFTMPAPHTSVPVMVSNRLDAFYVGFQGAAGNAVVHKVSDAGVIGQAWTLGIKQLWSMAVSPDETILYYAKRNLSVNDPGEPIKRWDLVNDVALADFNAGEPHLFFTKDFLCLDDGTLLVGYVSNTVSLLRHYATDGSTILEISTPTLVHTSGDRWALDTVDDSTFWIFTNANAVTQLFNVRVSDLGIVAGPLGPPQFERGIYAGSPGDVLAQKVGNSNSCPIVLTFFPFAAFPTPTSVGPAACPTGLPLAPGSSTPACASTL